MDATYNVADDVKIICSTIINSLSIRTLEFLKWASVNKTADVVVLIKDPRPDEVAKIIDTWIALINSQERNPFIRGEMVRDLTAIKACLMMGETSAIKRMFINLLFGR